MQQQQQQQHSLPMLNYGLPLQLPPISMFGGQPSMNHSSVVSTPTDTTNSLSVSPSVTTSLSNLSSMQPNHMQLPLPLLPHQQHNQQQAFMNPNLYPPQLPPLLPDMETNKPEKQSNNIKRFDEHQQKPMNEREIMKQRIRANRKAKQQKKKQKKEFVKKQLISLCKKELIKGHSFQNLYHLPKTRKGINSQREYENIDKYNYRLIRSGDAVILMEQRKMFGIVKNVTSGCMTVLVPISSYDDYIERNFYWETVFRMNAESKTYLVSMKRRK